VKTSSGDHVARVREQWRAVRPDLDTTPIEVVARVGRLAAVFDRSTNELMAEHGLSRSSWDVLASLRRTGPPYELTPTELYRQLMRSSGAMTNLLHRLERVGLIERHPHAADGRGVLVRLTRPGRRLVDEIAPAHMENERRLLASLSGAERDTLARLLGRLAAGVEREAPPN
jgi:DNA-binding MarR family transcriptional regulator